MTDLRNAIGDYLRALAESLQQAGENVEANGIAAWTRIAREHALTRVQLGFDVNQLIHEFIVLRRELFQIIQEEGFSSDGPQVNRLTDLIESAIAVSVQSYVDSRDFEFRRKEAEHIGFITHELKNPLTAAMMSISILKQKIQLPFEAKMPLEIAETNLGRMKGLIDGVLLAEKLEVDEAQLHPVELSLGSFMTPLLESARMIAHENHLRLETKFNPDLHLCIDRDLSESVIRNLIDNALKFSDSGVVSVDIEELGPDYLTFHVRDQCGGISKEELQTIFEPFKRAHSKKPGTGLGLTVARRGVEAQGGQIFAESSPGQGCHFWFTLPRQVQKELARKAG
jgi:signal transduction histidine kinase